MSTLRFAHTADNHLGLHFASRGYPESLRARLIAERFEALERVVGTANAAGSHFLVVAGDLFDSINVPRKDVDRAAEILRAFSGLHVVVLPGNHDFYESGAGKIWDRFRNSMGDHGLLLLTRTEPVHVPVDEREVIFYPGPCTSKTSAENVIGWVTSVPKEHGAVHVGVAHGSVSGVSPDTDDRYYQMSPDELARSGVDFWLLGHTHLQYPGGGRGDGSLFYFPSTSTPDGFDCDHEGYIWVIEVDDAKRVTASSHRTGRFRFYSWDRTVGASSDLERIEAECGKIPAASSLVKLVLRGRLSEEEMPLLQAFRERLMERLAYAEVSTEEIAPRIDRDYIAKHFTEGSLPSRLLFRLAESSGDELALHLAHDLIQEAKG
jgi:exonuclease SbcD